MNPLAAAKEIEKSPGGMRFIWRLLACVVWGLLLLSLTGWAVMALFFDVRMPGLRVPLAVGYGLAVLAVWVVVKRRWVAAGVTVGGFALVLAWWFTLRPSNERDWQPDVALLAYSDINGSQVTVHNIRNCDYRTETDYDLRHYDRTYDLDVVRTADLFMVYWGSPLIAHTMVSFGFEGGGQLCFSIETRKEKGEDYSAVKGLFRQFELIYIAADERDVIRLRTHHRRGEEVYLYRLNGSPAQVRKLLLSYLEQMNLLKEQPEWYNAIAHNCTTSIRMQRVAADRSPWDWRMLANGRGDELLYERGLIDTNLPLAELKQRAHINKRARTADKEADFSRLIRQGVPGIQ